jgi:hypothetical protein
MQCPARQLPPIEARALGPRPAGHDHPRAEKDLLVDLEGDQRGGLDLMIEQAGLTTQVERVGDRFDDAAGRLL